MDMEKLIAKRKRLNRNIYKNLDTYANAWLTLSMFLLGSSVIYDVLQDLLQDRLAIALALAFLGASVYWIYMKMIKVPEIEPYKQTDKFPGLFSIEDSTSIEAVFQNGLIPRDKEVEQLRRAVSSAFHSQRKTAVCMTGKSGCGKSAIINMFENNEQVKCEYEILDFSGKYRFLPKYAEQIVLSGKKTVVVMDQFERFFLLDEQQQKENEQVIRTLASAERDIVILFSMREEYFLRFLTRFDINDLSRRDGSYEGILYTRVPFLTHVTGNEHLLICVGDDAPGMSGKLVKDTIWGSCKEVFQEQADVIARIVENMPLIQKEIILNMVDNERRSTSDYLRFLGKEEQSLMRMYYDRQLCSTDNFFDASRIMYLLSMGRLHNLTFSRTNIMNALCISDCELKDFDACMEQLHDLQLIKRTTFRSKEYYEAAHDYIAQSYEVYANTEMPTEVKVSIDEYRAEFVNRELHKQNWQEEIGNKIKSHKDAIEYASQENKLHTQQNRCRIYADLIGYTAILFTILVYIGISFLSGRTVAAIGNSSYFIQLWQLIQFVFYVQKIPCTVFILVLASLLYVYTFYKNITRFYAGKTKWGVRLLYLAAMLMGCAAIVHSDHWLMWLGIGNTLLGISNLLVGQDKDMSSRGKQLFLSYGGKTAIVGILLVLLAGILDRVNINSYFSLVLELVPMAALLIYSFYSHMNREFFYSHHEAIEDIWWKKWYHGEREL